MEGFEVAGRRFRTEADYRAALRDQAKIEEIKAQINMEQPGEVITLYAEMEAGEYRFETAVGNDFDDEIYELAQDYKRQGYDCNSKLPTGKKNSLRGRRKADGQTKTVSAKKAGSTDAGEQKRTSKKKTETLNGKNSHLTHTIRICRKKSCMS